MCRRTDFTVSCMDSQKEAVLENQNLNKMYKLMKVVAKTGFTNVRK